MFFEAAFSRIRVLRSRISMSPPAVGWTVPAGAAECFEVFERIGLDRAMFEHPCFTRLAQVQHLLESGDLSDDLRWQRERAQRVHELSMQG